jgi:hypothetical protein
VVGGWWVVGGHSGKCNLFGKLVALLGEDLVEEVGLERLTGGELFAQEQHLVGLVCVPTRQM